MRILTIVNNLEAGGAQGSAKNASLAFLEENQSVAVLAFKGGGARAEPLREAGAEIFIGGESPAEIDRATADAAAWRPDVVHVHRSGHTDHAIAGMLRTIKNASSQRVAVIETNIFGRVDNSADEAQYDVHMMLSRWCLWKWQQWSRGLSPQPIGAVAPNIVRSDGFFPAGDDARHAFRAEHNIPQDAMVFGRIGQPIRAKWSYATFHAFVQFAAMRADAWFVAVGLPKKYYEFLATLKPEYRRRIVVVDFLLGEEALRACYAALDVFLHSSTIGESFGLVLAEAMLCERPVISLSTPARDNSQLEVVGHERGGLIAADVNSMAQAMHKLADDPALRARLGRQGRQWCLEHYDSPVVGSLMLRIATLAHQHADPAQLARALARDLDIITHVSTEEIRALLARQIGRPSMKDRVFMRLVHAPAFYRVWRVIRRFQRSARGPGDKQRMLLEQKAKRAANPATPPTR
jgi:glycosyltransferase involved in cell wall biosynthesis